MSSEQESANPNLVLPCMKTILYAFALLFSLSFIGCKPKETTLSGQAFIVTRGGENIKLGLVEVLLIEKKDVKEFIQQKQPAVDAEIVARQHEYEAAKDLLTTTNTVAAPDVDCAVITETNYLAMQTLFEIRNKQLEAERNAELVLRQQAEYSSSRYESGLSSSRFPSVNDALAVTQNGYRQKHLAIDIRNLSERIGSIKKQVADSEERLTATPKAAAYFDAFSPVTFQKAVTDADGRFLFSYPQDKTLTIFARAERLVGDKTEKYLWLVDAPAGVEKAQIFLSNNNLVFTDPDGYFKIKPKPELQEPTPQ